VSEWYQKIGDQLVADSRFLPIRPAACESSFAFRLFESYLYRTPLSFDGEGRDVHVEAFLVAIVRTPGLRVGLDE